MSSFIDFGSTRIHYTLLYSNRKSLGITVNADMEVSVYAPLTATPEKIKEKIRKRAPWILKQLSYFLSFQPKTPPKKFVSGESHLYLGKHYHLRVLTGANDVKIRAGHIEVYCPEKTMARKVLTNWYLHQAKSKFPEIADRWISRFQHYKVRPAGVNIRQMPTRWGSCTPKGNIILNPELIKAPKGCIEYVIVHELCHLVYRNHTKKFMDLQVREFPQWEKWKQKLEMLLA